MQFNHSVSSIEIIRSANLLSSGKLVAFPTETVYGLGADALNAEAVALIYLAKKRPADHPVIVHLPTHCDVEYWTTEINQQAKKLIDHFWPGPLTLILKRASHIPDAVSAGQNTVGLRCPSHPVAQLLLNTFANIKGQHSGVAAPSANLFGHVSPTTAQHVRDEFGESIYILEGGASEVGIESTIVDLSRGFPVILRLGAITPLQIAEVLGELPKWSNNNRGKNKENGEALLNDANDSIKNTPRVSGSLRAHYATRTPLFLMNMKDIQNVIAKLSTNEPIAILAQNTLSINNINNPIIFIKAPRTPDEYARKLYALLRLLDNKNATRILIEKLPETLEWAAINDRLTRAAAAFESV